MRPKNNDTSVTSWMVMALASAQAAGLHVDQGALDGGKAWIEKMTEPESGRVGYTTRGTGPARTQELLDKFPGEKSESLTAAGMLIRIFIGEDPHMSEPISKGARLCLKLLPEWNEHSGAIDMYYWHFATLALYRVGGNAWTRWNTALKPAILDHQQMDGDERGSWAPVGPWGPSGGRIYSTALCVMCMEAYYR